DSQKAASLPWSKDKLSLEEQIYSDEDLNELLQVLNLLTFEELGLRVNYPLDNFVGSITQTVMDKFIFEEDEFRVDDFLQFTQSLATQLGQLYLQLGTIKANPDDIYQKIIDAASENLDQADCAILVQKMQEMKPKQVEFQKEINEKAKGKESGDKLLTLFREFIDECQSKDRSTHSGSEGEYSLSRGDQPKIKVQIADIAKYRSELGQIFKEKQIQTPHELLVFLANFRKTIQADNELWGAHLHYDDLWNPLIEQIISENPQLNNFSNLLGKGLFDLKVALLLANNYASMNVIEPTKKFEKYFEDEEFNLEWFRSFYRLASDEKALAKETGIDTLTDSLLGVGKNEDWAEFFKEGKHILLRRTLN
ncbi:MAG: hypothetical protein Q7R33_05545, partial [Nitrosarchaeum sp.]|nr:hypothetical protein [Nitrosarchaeum sp.]